MAAAVLLAHNLSLRPATAEAADKMDKAVPYGHEVLLTGRLVMRTFRGPRVHSSVPNRAPVLELDHEVHVSQPYFPHEDPQTVRSVPLWIHREDVKEEASLEKLVASAVGRQVVIKVILFVGKTHHHGNITGDLQQLKLKGSRDFPALERSSPDLLAAAEAKEVARLEQLLKDKPPADFGPVAQFHRTTRLRGTLVERRLRAASSEDGWVDGGTKICWVLQLDQPITISASQYDGEITDVREVEITFGYAQTLVRRDLRALGVEAPVPWRGASEQLFEKHYEAVGRLSANFKTLPDQTPCAAARFWLDRIYSTPE